MLVTARCVSSQLRCDAQRKTLTDHGGSDSADDRGDSRLEGRVDGSNDSRGHGSPSRWLVRGRHDGCDDRLGGSLGDSRVDRRAGGRRPRDLIAAILRRHTVGTVASRRSSSDEASGGKNCHKVQGELHCF